jgi:hypothetical protein
VLALQALAALHFLPAAQAARGELFERLAAGDLAGAVRAVSAAACAHRPAPRGQSWAARRPSRLAWAGALGDSAARPGSSRIIAVVFVIVFIIVIIIVILY